MWAGAPYRPRPGAAGPPRAPWLWPGSEAPLGPEFRSSPRCWPTLSYSELPALSQCHLPQLWAPPKELTQPGQGQGPAHSSCSILVSQCPLHWLHPDSKAQHHSLPPPGLLRPAAQVVHTAQLQGAPPAWTMGRCCRLELQHSSPTYTLRLPAPLLPFAFLLGGKESLASPPRGLGELSPHRWKETEEERQREQRREERGRGNSGESEGGWGDLMSTGPGVPSPGLDKQLCHLLAHMAWAEPLDLSLSFPAVKWAPSTPPHVKLGGFRRHSRWGQGSVAGGRMWMEGRGRPGGGS